MTSSGKHEKTVLPSEVKHLERVFKRLCNYGAKAKSIKSMEAVQKRIDRIASHKQRPDTIKVFDEEGNPMSGAEIDKEFESLKKKKNDMQSAIAKIDKRPHLIHLEDMEATMRHLGAKKKKSELENMIWEVDENLDGCVDWEEFKLMYERNISDTTGLEPFELYNVVQFMMYDKDNSGKVSVDETMTMLYQRFGRSRLEKELHKLFGDDLKTTDGDGELDFNEYLKVVGFRMPKEAVSPSKKSH